MNRSIANPAMMYVVNLKESMAKTNSKKRRTRKADKSKAPKTPQERDELLAFLTEEILMPNNINVDIDLANPDALDKELNDVIQKKKIKRDEVGRPTVMTVPTLRKLKLAYLIDSTDAEACDFAGIGESTLYDFQKAHPQFSELKRKWKDTYIMAARLNVMRSVVQNKNVEDSKWLLKAKRNNEFAEKNITEHQNAVTADDLEKIANGDYEELTEE